jgi:MSHA biogenesis protein MshL
MTTIFLPVPSMPAGRMRPFSLTTLLSATLLAGCAMDRPLRTPDVGDAIRADLMSNAVKPPVATPLPGNQALVATPSPLASVEPRLDLLVNNAQARDVFLAIVADTPYSMLMHPDVAGTLSLTLRGVTVTQALEAIRDVYSYDFKIDGRRITIYAPTIQTRIFTINYPHSQRVGMSELRVASGVSQSNTQGSSVGSATGGNAGNTSSGNNVQQTETSRVVTTIKTDFWSELTGVVNGLIGTGEGRSVFSSPQAGIMAVRAMPEELRQVDKFLKAAQVSAERQVMLEAKIVEVELRDGFQSGVNWAAFGRGGSSTIAAGVLGSSVPSTNPLLQGGSTVIPGVVPVPSVAAGGGVFGLALATSQFATVLGFLETQGDVQTLSSPRVATLNNQKAVLKVGTDEFFVTNVSGGTSANTTTNTALAGSTTMPSLTLTPFFSGISLDVTPQIDAGTSVTLHVRPSVSVVTEKNKQIDLGSIGNYRLPLASSSVNEMDTLVRIQDGSIVAIGGLMQAESSRSASGLPGASEVPALSFLLGNRANIGRKKEVVILIKPTIIRTAEDWEKQTQSARDSLADMDVARARMVRVDGGSGSNNVGNDRLGHSRLKFANELK